MEQGEEAVPGSGGGSSSEWHSSARWHGADLCISLEELSCVTPHWDYLSPGMCARNSHAAACRRRRSHQSRAPSTLCQRAGRENDSCLFQMPLSDPKATHQRYCAFLFARGACVCIPEPQPNGSTFKYDCLLQFIVGQQRTRGNLCRSLCEVDSQVCASCRSFLPGFLLELGKKKKKKNYCDFFFFNDFIPCWKANMSGSEIITGNRHFACWLTGQEESSVHGCPFYGTHTKCTWQLCDLHSCSVHRIIVY